ncbi:hypothetical protein BLA29_014988, partial [Euroglyphus maynei]
MIVVQLSVMLKCHNQRLNYGMFIWYLLVVRQCLALNLLAVNVMRKSFHR